MKITDTHVYFWHGPFSNWHTAALHDPVTNYYFSNTEQAFMYYKAITFHDHEAATKILETPNPKEAKDLGRGVKGFNEVLWDLVKRPYMTYVNYLKFTQNESLKKILLDTGDKILVEASPYDKVWGVGLSEDDPKILDDDNW